MESVGKGKYKWKGDYLGEILKINWRVKKKIIEEEVISAGNYHRPYNLDM